MAKRQNTEKPATIVLKWIFMWPFHKCVLGKRCVYNFFFVRTSWLLIWTILKHDAEAIFPLSLLNTRYTRSIEKLPLLPRCTMYCSTVCFSTVSRRGHAYIFFHQKLFCQVFYFCVYKYNHQQWLKFNFLLFSVFLFHFFGRLNFGAFLNLGALSWPPNFPKH